MTYLYFVNVWKHHPSFNCKQEEGVDQVKAIHPQTKTMHLSKLR